MTLRFRQRKMAEVLFLSAAVCVSQVFGGRYWVGGSSALWSDVGNWASDENGTAADSAPGAAGTSTTYFPATLYPAVTIDGAVALEGDVRVNLSSDTAFVWSANESCGLALPSDKSILLCEGGGSPTHLQIDGGDYSANYLRVGHAAGCYAELVQNGGTIALSQLRVASVSGNVTGVLRILGGQMTVSGTAGTSDANGNSSEIVVDGGHLSVGSLWISGANDQSYSDATATVTVESGTLNVQTLLYVGANSGEGSYGSLVVNGGEVSAPELVVNRNGKGRFTMTGGTVTLQDGDNANGVYLASQGRAGAIYVDLSGGTLVTPRFRIEKVTESSPATIRFNGTTIKATRNHTNFLDANANVVCEIDAGGLVVDTNGHDVHISHDLSGVGGIVKKGAGRLYLDGANNTFSGGVRVLQGQVIGNGVSREASLNYLHADAADRSYVNAQYVHKSNTRVEATFESTEILGNTWRGVFGARKGSFNSNAFVFFTHDGGGHTVYNRSGQETRGTRFPFGEKVNLVCEGSTATLSSPLGGVQTITTGGTVDDGVNSMLIFNLNTNNGNGVSPDGSWSTMSLYSFDISENDNGTYTPKRSFTPHRTADGRLGLWDSVDGVFIEGNGNFSYGFAYDMDGSKLLLFDGESTPHDPLPDCDEIEKTTVGEMAVGALVGIAQPFSLSEGVLSLANGTAGDFAFGDSLSISGGTEIVFDLTDLGCDRIDADSLSFSGASSANPVRIRIVMSHGVDRTQTYTLIGSGVAAEDVAAMVLLDAEEFAIRAENGALVLYGNDTTSVVKSTWTNALGDGDLSNPANWESVDGTGSSVAAVPSEDTVVLLTEASGAFSVPSGSSFTCRELKLPATLGGDTDLRNVTVPVFGPAQVNLNGHSLWLPSAVGSELPVDGVGRFVDTSANQVEYIRSSRQTGDVYIDTEYIHTPTTRVEAVLNVDVEQRNAWCAPFGARNVNFANNCYAFFSHSDNILRTRYARTGSETWVDGTVFSYGSKSTLVCEGRESRWWTEDDPGSVVSLTSQGTADEGVNTMFVFNLNRGGPGEKNPDGSWCLMTLYSFKMYEGETLVRDFVPALDGVSGTYGLYDRVEGRFHANLGNGRFEGATPVSMPSVYIDVPAGVEVRNTRISFAGGMRVVKTGGGTYVTEVNSSQSLGLYVEGGTVMAGARGAEVNPCAIGGEIHIGPDGAFELACWKDFYSFKFVLDGGRLLNAEGTNSGRGEWWNFASIADVKLTADSVMYNPDHYASRDSALSLRGWNDGELPLDLGGHLLSLSMSEGAISNVRTTPGAIDFSGSCTFRYRTSWFTNTVFTNRGEIVVWNGIEAHFGDFVNLATEDYGAQLTSDDSGSMFVHGTFKPVGDCFRGCILADGATLDLSDRTGTWSTVSTTAKVNSPNEVLFADDATVCVKLGDRWGGMIGGGGKVVGWETVPQNVQFTTDREGRRLQVRSDGLYVLRGIAIIVR